MLPCCVSKSVDISLKLKTFGPNKIGFESAAGSSILCPPSANKNQTKAIKTIIGKRKVVVFASTHKGEEEKIIHAYLNQPLDALMLIIP
jgi:3-deoxy-D-manno-octulosonic-acid transferase